MTNLIVALCNTANAPNNMRSGGVGAVYTYTCRQSLIVDLDVIKKTSYSVQGKSGKLWFLRSNTHRLLPTNETSSWLSQELRTKIRDVKAGFVSKTVKRPNVAHGFCLHTAHTVPHLQSSWTTIILQLKSLWKNTMGQTNVFTQLSICRWQHSNQFFFH